MIKSNKAICPACNRKSKEKPYFISRKTFNSYEDFKYFKCGLPSGMGFIGV